MAGGLLGPPVSGFPDPKEVPMLRQFQGCHSSLRGILERTMAAMLGRTRLLCEIEHGVPERTLLPLPTGRLRVQSTFADGTLRVCEYEMLEESGATRLGRLMRA